MLSPAEQIKDRLDILDVIQGYVQLSRAGANYRACCPFHSERTPSFTVSPEKQIWHCFGCGLGGDIFSFVMQIEGVEFRDALRILADKAGIQLSKQDPKLASQKEKLENILKKSVLYFQNQLVNNSEGKLAMNYLIAERGLARESIEKFSIGYAPSGWDGLSNFLISDGEKKEDITASGMAYQKSDGSGRVLDRFRGRIMFPIASSGGRIIGFTGRMFDRVWKEEERKSQGKYVNTPQTILFNKSLVLYGLDKAKIAIRRLDGCVLVEGQMDVIASHQAGVENAIAASGTALTLEQLQIIKRLTNNLILAFDMDEAGINAAQKGIDRALNLWFNVKVVKNLQGKDAAEIIKTDPELWRKAVENSLNVMDFYFDLAFDGADLSNVDNKKKAAAKILPVIARISNKVERAHYIHKLADKLGVSDKILEDAISPYQSRPQKNFQGSKEAVSPRFSKTKQELLEERVLSILSSGKFCDAAFLERLELFPGDFKIPKFQIIAESVWKILKNKKRITCKDLSESLAGKEAACVLNYLWILAEEIQSENFISEFKRSAYELKILSIRNILKSLSEDIKKAEQDKDKSALKVLVEEFERFSKKLIKLESEKI